MKTASQSAAKFVARAAVASGDYVKGAQETTKDQAAAAVAAEAIYQAGLTASFGRKAFSKGLQKSGKQGWLDGVVRKGANRFADGVQSSADRYATESGKYDAARNTASTMPRGPKGSAANYERARKVGEALRTAKVGSA